MTQHQPPTTQWDLLSKCKSLRVPSRSTETPTRTREKVPPSRYKHLCTTDRISPGEHRCIGTHFLLVMKRCSQVYGTFNIALEIRKEKCKNKYQNINLCTQRAAANDIRIGCRCLRMSLARCCHLKCGGMPSMRE